MSHTPAPWSFDGPHHSIIVWGAEPEQRVCFMTSDGPAEANARLIAAAPEMYEALTWVVDHMCEGFCKDLPLAGTYYPDMDEDCAACKARAALAKAGSRS